MYVWYFIEAKTQDLHYYIVPSLLKKNPEFLTKKAIKFISNNNNNNNNNNYYYYYYYHSYFNYFQITRLLPPIRAVETVECVREYVDRISQNLQSVSLCHPRPPTVFSFLWIMVKQVKSLSQTTRYQRVNHY